MRLLEVFESLGVLGNLEVWQIERFGVVKILGVIGWDMEGQGYDVVL